MWRVLVYLAIVAALAAGAIWLADQPGRVAFVWDGTSYSVGLALGAILLVVAVAGLLVLEALIRFVLGLPERVSEATVGRKRRKGLVALSRGMVAVGAGDEASARRYSREAQKYLKADEPLVLLLRAQAAQIAGDHSDAKAAFQAMAQTEDTRVLGLRGLYVEARRRGDRDAAYLHAREAAKLAPSVSWANEAVLESYVAKGDWKAALDLVERRAALGVIDKATSKRHRAVLMTADALSHGEADEDAALERAKEALRLAPDLVPAAVLAGRILARRLEVKKAAKIVEAAWKVTPHPDLADVYVHLRTGDSTHDRMERAEKLATLSTWSLEGRLALARAALEAREFKKARETLAVLAADRPPVRVCLLMAEIERAEHGSGVAVREWLARAVHAPRDKAWVADGIVSDRWAPISPVTGRLDAFEWREPPEGASAAGTAVIDAVVGDLDDAPRQPISIEPPVYKQAALAPQAAAQETKPAPTPPVPTPPPAAPAAPAASAPPPRAASEAVIVTPTPAPAPAPQKPTAHEEPVRTASAAPAPAPETRPAPSPAAAAAATAPVAANAPEPAPAPSPSPSPAPAPKPDPAAAIVTPSHVRRETPPAPRSEAAPAPVAASPVAASPVAASPVASASVASSPAEPAPAEKAEAAAEPAPSGSLSDRDRINAAVARATRKETLAAPAPTPAAEPAPEAEEPPPFATRPPDDPGVPEEPEAKPQKRSRFRLFG